MGGRGLGAAEGAENPGRPAGGTTRAISCQTGGTGGAVKQRNGGTGWHK